MKNKSMMDGKNNNCENVKECLQSEKLSNFEILMSEIKNNLLNTINNRAEVGRARHNQRDLPAHVDRTFTTFGLCKKDPCRCADVIHGEYINYLSSDDQIQTNLPGTQKKRGYQYPFKKELLFGKATNADIQGNKTKKLLHCFENDLRLKNINNLPSKSHSPTFFSRIKEIQKTKKSSNIAEILRQAPVNQKIEKMKKSLSHINALRLKLKKRNFSDCFMDLYEHFRCIDKDLLCTVPLDTFYRILKKVNITPDTEMFEFLLKEFNFITKNSSVFYMEALNLLNCKSEFPSLFKIDDLPKELQYYSTTYKDSMKVRQ